MSEEDSTSKLVCDRITEQIIGAAIEVHRELGPGLLESTYEACLAFELTKRGLEFKRQVALPVIYQGNRIDCGYRIDLLVEGQVIVELKAIEKHVPIHEAQLMTHLRLADLPVGLLINFNVKLLKDGITRRANTKPLLRALRDLRGESSGARAAAPVTSDVHVLPPNLPVPTDDGACLHLRSAALPKLSLACTDGRTLPLHDACASRAVLFFYPRTGIPGQPPSLGFRGEEWDSIPGARGCTPQSCGFRDLFSEFRALGIDVFGVSTNTTEHQREFKQRNHVPFEFLSDSKLDLVHAMNLPTFEFPVESGGPTTMVHRMAWYIERDPLGTPRIVKVWYPVFPPNKNAETVLAWLKQRAAIHISPIANADIDYVRETLHKHWHSTTIYSIDKPYQADALPGFIARIDGQRAGLITLAFYGQSCEVITLSSDLENRGIGEALMDAAVNEARKLVCARVFLTTSNDNLRALGFYQKRGFSLVTVHRGMMNRYRDTYNKTIPLIGSNGIPLRDELELELRLDQNR